MFIIRLAGVCLVAVVKAPACNARLELAPIPLSRGRVEGVKYCSGAVCPPRPCLGTCVIPDIKVHLTSDTVSLDSRNTRKTLLSKQAKIDLRSHIRGS
jgi:hypothetical protein